ncbi:SCP-like protein [Ancylostoma caninum]|uniref:SCP-like protein n=1 Tax=Ancylostoma caninum TaxID=29170 RepID=A0A368HAU6_ANCCA|nr:SCP-like protein [Ancylostoma caninum]
MMSCSGSSDLSQYKGSLASENHRNMAKLSFVALVVASLLPALCEGQPVVLISPLCSGGHLDRGTINNGILNPVNYRRIQLAKNTQRNGLNGRPPFLPPATNMTELVWSCDLEKAAVNALGNGCQDPSRPKPPDSKGTANVFGAYPDYFLDDEVDAIFSQLLGEKLSRIDKYDLPVHELGTVLSLPKYNDNPKLLDYSNLVRATNTEIGCAMNRCPGPNRSITLYCLMNGKSLQRGENIYRGTSTNTEGCGEVICPAGYKCNVFTYVCVKTTTVDPSPTRTTSTSTTTRAPATVPPSPNAEFPYSSSKGACSMHAYANKMTDVLRNEYIMQHNRFRSLLANGNVMQKDGRFLPMASNMRNMMYDCELEEEAIKYASQCPWLPSDPSTRPLTGEVFETFTATGVQSFENAARQSIIEWWKVVSDVDFFGESVIYRDEYEGQPISSFTQMAWAESSRVGCSIVKCSNRYVTVCRYSPKGNIRNDYIYKRGQPCTVLPDGAHTCTAGALSGLWF